VAQEPSFLRPICRAPVVTVTRRIQLAGIVALVLVGLDLARPPDRQITAKALVTGIHLYQRTLARAMPALGVQCRLRPTCSHYAEVVIARRGAAAGTWLTLKRLVRCGPWTPMGTVDEPN
jgi:putative membrane protein insertion efficiency factor